MRTLSLAALFAASCLAQSTSFLDVCAAGSEAALIAAGLANPGVALRDYSCYAKLPFAQNAVERFALADPEEAVAVASNGSPDTNDLQARLAQSAQPAVQVLAQLASNPSAAAPERRRAAPLAFEIARGTLSVGAALQLAGKTPAYFARLTDLRFTAAADSDEARAIDTALEQESLNFCHAVAESQARGLMDLAQFRARDLYMTLAYGYAALVNSSYGQDEPADPVFTVIFDRLFLPKLRTDKSTMTRLLDESHGVALRQFVAGALATHRLDAFLNLAGPDATARLARHIDGAPDALDRAAEIADLIAGTRNPALLRQIGVVILEEYARVSAAGPGPNQAIYGLLAAALPNPSDAVRSYSRYLAQSTTLDVAALFGPQRRCVERYFFWDDDDGVSSFEHFKSGYAHDPAWKIDDLGIYIRIAGRGPDGRVIEIYANRPIDIRQPQNRSREGESLRRQAAIDEALRAAGVTASVLVHRGHSFHVSKTLEFVTPAARLVILGSCRGITEIRAVMDRSHDAQVIATLAKGQTQVNDALLKTLNTTLLSAGPKIDWRTLWSRVGLRGFLAPSQDPASVFLRAYYLSQSQ